MNKIVFFVILSLVSPLFADVPVEMEGQSLRRLSEELATLQRFVYKRFGGDPAYQEGGINPPQDASQTMLLEKINNLSTRFLDLTNKMEELQHQVSTIKNTTEKMQAGLDGKVTNLEKQLSQTNETVKKSEDQSYQDKINKMTADELFLHIETLGRILSEDRFEKALRLFITKFPEEPRTSSIYKELVYLTYKKEAYAETALYAGEFYKKSPQAPETPEILLMMAFALEKLEKPKEACMTLDKITTDYPDTSEDFKERLTMANTSFSCPV